LMTLPVESVAALARLPIITPPLIKPARITRVAMPLPNCTAVCTPLIKGPFPLIVPVLTRVLLKLP
jgi:hypothetical protein